MRIRILLIKYLEKQLQENIIHHYWTNKQHKKKTSLWQKKYSFINAHINAITAVSMAKLHELHFELVNQPSYSLDLTPCDTFLFLNLKK